ncbi:MAG: hypothetical protein U9O86_06520 [Campylobacterota bacterium]|nr:hypothetical protein [Campylobacterota bacterium]
MSEPRLEDIGDYNTLKGEKKRVVWAVIIAGCIIGAIYVIASNNYGTVEDSINTTDTIKNIPIK